VFLVFGRTAPAEGQREDQEQGADDDVERRVEVRLLGQCDRPSEQHENTHEEQQSDGCARRITRAHALAIWAREDDGLLDEHQRTDRARQAEGDDECEHLEHGGWILGCDTLGIGRGGPTQKP
jgi:hypothetical protein